jgi:hypothetical protein
MELDLAAVVGVGERLLERGERRAEQERQYDPRETSVSATEQSADLHETGPAAHWGAAAKGEREGLGGGWGAAARGCRRAQSLDCLGDDDLAPGASGRRQHCHQRQLEAARRHEQAAGGAAAFGSVRMRRGRRRLRAHEGEKGEGQDRERATPEAHVDRK